MHKFVELYSPSTDYDENPWNRIYSLKINKDLMKLVYEMLNYFYITKKNMLRISGGFNRYYFLSAK